MEGKEPQLGTQPAIGKSQFHETQSQHEPQTDPVVDLFAKTRERARAAHKRLTTLCEIATSDSPDTGETAETPLTVILDAKQFDADPEKYLRISRGRIVDSQGKKERFESEKEKLEGQRRTQSKEYQDVQDKLDDLKYQKGVRKPLAALQAARLRRQQAEIDANSRALGRSISTGHYGNRIAELQRNIDYSTGLQAGALQHQASELAIDAFDNYAELFEACSQEERLSSQIKDSYISMVMAPYVRREFVKPDFLTSEQADELVNYLRNEFVTGNKEISQKASATVIQALAGLNNTVLEPLSGQPAGTIAKNVIASIAREEVAGLDGILRREFSDKYTYHTYMAVERDKQGATFPPGTPKRELADAIINVYNLYGFINMDLWIAAKSAPRAHEIFGEEISKEDKRIYEWAIKGSLTDVEGKHIDALVYYPTPDAIRNIVLLAAADQKPYRTVHANNALWKLARRDDWSQLLDATQEKYPELAAIRDKFENWTWDKFESNPQITHLVDEFAASLLNDPNPEVASISREALSTARLLTFAQQKGFVTEQHVSDLKQALTILNEIAESGESIVFVEDNPQPIGSYFLDQNVRASLFGFFNNTLGDKLARERLPALTELARKVVEVKDDKFQLAYLSGDFALGLLNKTGHNEESIKCVVNMAQTHPHLVTNYSLRNIFSDYGANFLNPKDLDFLTEVHNKYEKSAILAGEVAGIYKESGQDQSFFLTFPDRAGIFLTKDYAETGKFILGNGQTLIRDDSDYKFLTQLVGEHGKKADRLIRDYCELLKQEVITNAQKAEVLEFLREYRVLSPGIVAGYLEAKRSGQDKLYFSQLRSLSEKLTGAGEITADERQRPYYQDLIKAIYPYNSGHWSTYESNATCEDRSQDLAKYKIKPRYEIDLLSQSEIRVRDGEVLDAAFQRSVQQPIYSVFERMKALNFDYPEIRKKFESQVSQKFAEAQEAGAFSGIDTDQIQTPDEKLFLLMTDSLYGTSFLDQQALKDLMTSYEFAYFEDISDYIAGTRDRVGQASNQDYALLCEVESFYSDRIKEVNRRLVQSAFDNPEVARQMEAYFGQLASENVSSGRRERVNRMQLDKLGESAGFISQLAKLLKKRNKREYTPERVSEIVRRYESITKGLQGQESTSARGETRAFYGLLRSQRERTFNAFRELTGENIDPETIHLGEMKLKEAADAERAIAEGKYDPEQFATFTVQRLIDLFESERNKIQLELAKFESSAGKTREVLYSYFAKTKETANARMVGGVCVSGDNPAKGSNNMWDMPNYFQLVLQDPDSSVCLGLALLHEYQEGGKKYLAASLNPSSTYLYTVDEAALFKGLMTTLESFAADNDFNAIVLSTNSTIRTNRTGGEFEKAMNARVAQVGKNLSFSTPQQFSYNPFYSVKDVNVVWENK